MNAISTGSQQVAVIGDSDVSPLESKSSTSSKNELVLSNPKNRKLSKIGKAESMQIPNNLQKFSSSDSENQLINKRRRNSGRQSIRVAQDNWLKAFSGVDLLLNNRKVITSS